MTFPKCTPVKNLNYPYCSKECVTRNFSFPRTTFDWAGQYFLSYNPFRGRRHETFAYFLFFNYLTHIVTRYICKKGHRALLLSYLLILVIVYKSTDPKNLASLKSASMKIVKFFFFFQLHRA